MTARLRKLVATAAAMTRGEAASAQGASELLNEIRLALAAMLNLEPAAEPELEALERELLGAVNAASPSAQSEARSYQMENIKWRAEPPPIPTHIAAFLALEEIEIARTKLGHERLMERYESLRRPEDACDCRVRRDLALCSQPSAPLNQIELSGVPFAALETIWKCSACGTIWIEDESHDDMGRHVTWRISEEKR
jgi:rubrerythrin